VLEVEVRPTAKFGYGMLGKELRRTSVPGQIPSCGLGAIFAKLGGVGFGRLGPGATHAHETAGLVLPKQLFAQFDRAGLFSQNHGTKTLQRSPTADGAVVMVCDFSHAVSGILIV
jgi:hypothetical protein